MNILFLITLIIVRFGSVTPSISNSTQTEVCIGGILHSNAAALAFNASINIAHTLFPNLLIKAESYVENGQYESMQYFIDLARSGAVALVGPYEYFSVMSTAAVATASQIPFISYGGFAPQLSTSSRYSYLARTLSGDDKQARAIVESCQFFGWDQVALLIGADPVHAHAMEALIDYLSDANIMIMKKYYLPEAITASEMSTAISTLYNANGRIIIYLFEAEYTEMLYESIEEYGMDRRHWVFFGLHDTFDYMDPTNEEYYGSVSQSILRKMKGIIGLRRSVISNSTVAYTQLANNLGSESMSLSQLHVADAVLALIHALNLTLSSGYQLNSDSSVQLDDGYDLPYYTNGSVLSSFLEQVQFDGPSGPVYFVDRVTPTPFDLINIQMVGGKPFHSVVGQWWWNATASGFDIYTSSSSSASSNDASLIWPDNSAYPSVPRSSVYQVARAILPASNKGEAPLFLYNADGTLADCFMKNIIEDIINSLGQTWDNIDWTYAAVDDQTIVQLLDANDNFDVAFVDFPMAEFLNIYSRLSHPFSTTSVSLLVYQEETSNLWLMFTVFDTGLWMSIAAVMIVVSITLWILERGMKYSDDFPVTYTGLVNGFWQALMGTFATPTTDLLSILSKVVYFMYLCFVLVIVSSYTANMAAFLTEESSTQSVHSLGDVSHSAHIGVKQYSLAEAFFHTQPQFSNVGIINSYEEGLAKLETGELEVVAGETVYLEEFAKQNCNARLLFYDYYPNNLVFAFSENIGDELEDSINSAIIELWDSEQLNKYEDDWFSEWNCDHIDYENQSDADAFGINDAGGVFIVLAVVWVVLIGIHFGRKRNWCCPYRRPKLDPAAITKADQDKAEYQDMMQQINEGTWMNTMLAIALQHGRVKNEDSRKSISRSNHHLKDNIEETIRNSEAGDDGNDEEAKFIEAGGGLNLDSFETDQERLWRQNALELARQSIIEQLPSLQERYGFDSYESYEDSEIDSTIYH